MRNISSVAAAKTTTKWRVDFDNDSSQTTIFVVDDDPSFLRAIKRLLESADYVSDLLNLRKSFCSVKTIRAMVA